MTTLSYWDGFENPDNPNWTKWGWGPPIFHTDEGRDGGSISMGDTWGALILATHFPSWSSGFAVGVAVRPMGVENLWGIITFGISPTSVYICGSGLCCSNGQLCWGTEQGGLLAGQLGLSQYLGGVLRAECWNHIEMHVHAGGYITLWINGLYLPPQSVDFHADPNVPLDKICLGARTSWIRTDTSTRYFDDFYFGPIPVGDAPIGDLAVTTYFPVSNGTHTDWDCKTGTDHFEMVNESPDDADGSYVVSVEADGIGNQDTYVFEIVEHSGTPIDVQPHWRARKTNIGERTMRAIARLDTTEIYSVPFHVYGWWVDNTILLTDYQSYPRGAVEFFTIPLDPDGNPWTWENLEICEFGQEIYA